MREFNFVNSERVFHRNLVSCNARNKFDIMYQYLLNCTLYSSLLFKVVITAKLEAIFLFPQLKFLSWAFFVQFVLVLLLLRRNYTNLDHLLILLDHVNDQQLLWVHTHNKQQYQCYFVPTMLYNKKLLEEHVAVVWILTDP